MLANKIKSLRTEKALTQTSLAESLGVSQQTIGSWEVGRTAPDPDTIIRLARFFNCSTDYLLGMERDMEPTQPMFAEVFETLTLKAENYCGKMRAKNLCPGDCGFCQRDFYWRALHRLRAEAKEEMRQVMNQCTIAKRKQT